MCLPQCIQRDADIWPCKKKFFKKTNFHNNKHTSCRSRSYINRVSSKNTSIPSSVSVAIVKVPLLGTETDRCAEMTISSVEPSTICCNSAGELISCELACWLGVGKATKVFEIKSIKSMSRMFAFSPKSTCRGLPVGQHNANKGEHHHYIHCCSNRAGENYFHKKKKKLK